MSHEGIFDLETGEFLRQTTQQGWRDSSSWARGLAWSLYGFTSMHALTGNPHWLTTAIANAEYWIEHTSGNDPVPPNDFDEPEPAASVGVVRCGLRRRRTDHAGVTGRRRRAWPSDSTITPKEPSPGSASRSSSPTKPSGKAY